MIDQILLERLQYHLLEAPDGGMSWPSGLWTRDEILSCLNQRQTKFLKNALLLITTSQPSVPVAINATRLSLPADLIRLVSVIWQNNTTNGYRELLRVDSYSADHLIPTWDQVSTSNPTDPLAYMEYETPTLQIQIAPGPKQAGVLTLLYVPKGTAPTGNGVTLTVPDEFTQALLYGTLADLLSKDGRGQDLARAEYCQQRFDLTVDLARIILEGWA